MTTGPDPDPAGPSLLSVIIPNHNYGRFVAQAVDSALGLDWPDVQVIVVDDGSTDNSLEVLRAYSNRITLVVQENAGPRVACNRGFAEARGDAVVFLDSDDALEPSLVREVARAWGPNVSKVQVQMRRVDVCGAPTGSCFPRYRRTPTPDEIREWLTITSEYPTPPGSGNVYARWFLDRMMPLDDRCGDATDSACLAAAPFYGDVRTIPRPLARYRVHASNRSRLSADPRRFARQLERARQRQQLVLELSGSYDDGSVLRSLRRGRHLLQMRTAASRLGPGPPSSDAAERGAFPGDRRRRLAVDAVASLFSPGPESLRHRVAVCLWCLATLIAPRRIVERLIIGRFP